MPAHVANDSPASQDGQQIFRILDALTSYELSRYRRQLEHALKAVPRHDPAWAGLQQRLAAVQAEQHSRTTITATGGQT